MAAMPERLGVDGLTAARDFTRLVAPRFAGRDAYGIVTWNYMPPAGGTQVHPHMQVVVTTTPGNAVTRMLVASDAYVARTGAAFSHDLFEASRRPAVDRRRKRRLARATNGSGAGDAMAIFRGGRRSPSSMMPHRGFAATLVRSSPACRPRPWSST
jgi:hypothetical protein